MKPAVVIAAYNRPDALGRLLDNIAAAQYPSGVPLIISIDPGGSRQSEVASVAHRFEWGHGTKRVIVHQAHLGLVQHVYFTAGLASEYGAVIRLEDDYFVSPVYYDYASQGLAFYRDDPRIAGLSLYSVWFHGYTLQPFAPYLDDGDAYFMQTPWSQGQAFTAAQWEAYTTWRASNPRITLDDPIHEVYTTFDAEDWFPLATKYLAETNRFYVFPRESVSTNFGDAGTHFAAQSRYFQVPLQTRRREFRFQTLDAAIAVYDSYQEMLPDRLNRLTDQLSGYDYSVDLNGSKSAIKVNTPYVLTTRPCRNPIRAWGCELHPREVNIVMNVFGNEIVLCRKQDVRRGRLAHWQMRRRHYEYGQRRYAVSISDRVMMQIMGWLEKLLPND